MGFSSKKKLKLPYYPDNKEETLKYDIESTELKLIADYCNISVFEVENINFIQYYFLHRDAFIYKLSQTQGGREYLEKCWILEQKKPDTAKLKKLFGKGE